MLESATEKKCRKEAIKRRWLVYKLNPTNNRGAFDRAYASPSGVTIFVEHKQTKGAKRAHQEEEQRKLRKRGHVAEFVFSFESFCELIGRFET